jgi:L-threonylcarbamoyladenylate synthase
VLGQPLGDRDAAAPRAPGTLESHYAPRARVRLMSELDLRAGLDTLAAASAADSSGAPPRVAVYSCHPFPHHAAAIFQAMPVDAAAAAHELFSVLRHFDEQGVGLIWVETPPAHSEWDGVRDRLVRAAA